ncbi:MAG TPA: hypothetical protein VJ781_10155 [Pyrinomonadaceae bacterium]|nr:hypothetical protein [Pyrinomonadaceae bacterium]
MIIRRTSIKSFIAALIFLSIYIFAAWSAERYYESTSPIRFGNDFGRPWNPWDYFAVTSVVLSVSLIVVALMFLDKND